MRHLQVLHVSLLIIVDCTHNVVDNDVGVFMNVCLNCENGFKVDVYQPGRENSNCIYFFAINTARQ